MTITCEQCQHCYLFCHSADGKRYDWRTCEKDDFKTSRDVSPCQKFEWELRPLWIGEADE